MKSKKNLVTSFILGTILIMTLFSIEFVSATWYNESFIYKKQINLTGIVNVNSTLHLNFTKPSNMNETYKDLRFVNSSETGEIPYYIEWSSPTDIVVTVRVDNNETIYMYYGSENTETNISNFDATKNGTYLDAGQVLASCSNGAGANGGNSFITNTRLTVVRAYKATSGDDSDHVFIANMSGVPGDSGSWPPADSIFVNISSSDVATIINYDIDANQEYRIIHAVTDGLGDSCYQAGWASEGLGNYLLNWTHNLYGLTILDNYNRWTQGIETIELSNASYSFGSEISLLAGSISLNFPKNNSIFLSLNNIFNCSIDSTIPVLNISLFIDGGEIYTVYNFTANQTFLELFSLQNISTEEQHNWTCKAENETTIIYGPTRNFLIDISGPNITLISPSNDSLVFNPLFNFIYNLTDLVNYTFNGSGILNSTIYIYNQTDLINQTTTFIFDDIFSTTVQVPIALINGIYTWFADAYDYLGNYRISENNTFTMEIAYPFIEYANGTAVNGANLSQSNIYINVTIDQTNLTNITFNLYNETPYLNLDCYQEFADVNTSCGGLDTGSYTTSVSGGISGSIGALYDGVWTSCVGPSTGGGYIYLWTNYTKPLNALNSSLWQVRAGGIPCSLGTSSIYNFTIPVSCWNYGNDLSFFANMTTDDGITIVSCYNGTDFEFIYNFGGLAFFEEAMEWVIPKSVIAINQTIITNFTDTSINWTDLINGDYWYNVWAINIYNNLNSTDLRKITLDTQDPNINLISPLDSSYASNINFKYNLTDLNNYTLNGSGIFNTTLYVYNQTDFINQTAVTTIENIFSSTVEIPMTLVDGAYTWFADAFDYAGNYAVTENWTVNVDSTYPTIEFGSGTLSSGVNASQNNIYVNITYTEINPANITFNLHSINETIITSFSILDINWTNLANGRYDYNVRICDLVNNCNSTETRSVWLDVNAPNITLTSPLNNSYLNFTDVNFIYTIDDINASIPFNPVFIGLTDYWNFDETSGYNASNQIRPNTAVSTYNDRWISGKIGGAYNITAIAYALNVSNPADYISIINPTNPITFSAWINLPINDYSGGGMGTLFGVGLAPGKNFEVISGRGGPGSHRLSIIWDGFGNYMAMRMDAQTTIDTWQHLVVTYSGSNNINSVKFYLDGVLQNNTLESAGDPSWSNPSNDVFIGNAYDLTGGYTWVGSVDELGIWNRTLNDSEVMTLYNSGAGLAYENRGGSSGIFNTTIYVYNQTDLVNQTTIEGTSLNNLFSDIIGIPIFLIDGIYTWFADAFDYADNYQSTENQTFTVDTISPVIEITFPEAINYTIFIPTELNYTLNETNPDTCWYNLDGGTNITITCGDNVTGLLANQGTNTWNVFVNDSVNFESSDSITFYVDTIYPFINITAPVNATHINNLTAPQNFTALINDSSGIANVTFRIYNETDGELLNETFTAYSGELQIDYGVSFQPPEGRWLWFIEAQDIFGHMNKSENRTIVVDNELPDIVWIYPPESSYLRLHTNPLAINVGADDAYLDAVNLTVTNVTGGIIYNNFTQNLTSVSFYFTDNITFSRGNNTIEVCARDSLSGSPKISDKANFAKVDNSETHFRLPNGDLVLRKFTVYDSSDKKIKESDINLVATDSWIDNGKHYKTTWDLNNLPAGGYFIIEMNYQHDDLELKTDRGVTRIIDKDRNYYWNFNDLVANGFNVQYDWQQKQGKISVIVTQGSYVPSGTAWSLDPIVGGLNTNCENVTLYIDTNASVITPIYPLNGTYINTSIVNISYNIIEDAGIINTTFYLYNQTDLVNQTSAFPIEVEITLGYLFNLTDDIYTWFADVYDGGLNYVKTFNQTFIIDTITPTIDYTTGTAINGANLSQDNIFINVSITEANLANVTFWLFNETSLVNSTTWTDFSINWTTLPDAHYHYNVTVIDILLHSNSTQTRYITLDTANPNIQLIYPANNSYLTEITLNYSMNDSLSGLFNTTVYVYNQTNLINQTTNQLGGVLTSLIGMPISLIDGFYTWFAEVYDQATNYQKTTNQTFTLDTIYPLINYTEPKLAEGFQALDALWVNVTAQDTNLANITLIINGTLPLGGSYYDEQILNDINNSVQSFFYNWTGLTQGFYNITSYVYDRAGHRTNNTVLFYNLDNEAPNMTYNDPTLPSGSLHTLNYFPVNVSADDPNYVNMTLNIYNSLGIIINSTFTTTKNIDMITQNLTDGFYYYNASSIDTAENIAWLPTRNITIEYAQINITICRTLNTPYASYIVTQNLITTNGTCINILVPGANIDCQGHSIIGNAAIWARKIEATLRNCIVMGNNDTSYALKVEGNSPASITIFNSTFSGSLFGIYIAPESQLSADTINVYNNVYGIYFNYSNNNNVITNSLFSGNTEDTITMIQSSANQFNGLTVTSSSDTSNDGIIKFVNSSDNLISGSNFTTTLTNLFYMTNYSVNNTLYSSYYGSGKETIDGTSQLIRMWSFTGLVQDSVYNKLQGALISFVSTLPTNQIVNYSDGRQLTYGTLSGNAITNSPGIGIAPVIQYMNIFGTTYTSTPYNFTASYLNFVPTHATIAITDNTYYEFTLEQEIASSSLSRTAMWLILGLVFLIGLAASVGFFMVRMREGYSVVDIWKYFIILVIWLVLFSILFWVLAWFIMGSYYPRVVNI